MRASILAFVLVFFVATTARAQPETHGSHAFATWGPMTVTLAGAPIPVEAYYPTDGGGPFPVLAVVHGASRNLTYMAEMARTFASRGYVVLTPSMPCTVFGCNHAANAMQIRALLDWGVAQSADATTPIAGLVDGSRRGVVGHSWGGLAVFLAAQGHPEIGAIVVLDPNDDAGLAATAAPSVTQPSAHVMAQVMGTCNATNWKDTVFPRTSSPHMRVMVTGAGHCDVEDPTDGFCATFCTAGAGISLAPYFRRYAVAFMGCVLQSDTAMAPWIGGAQLTADTSSNVVQYVSSAGLGTLPCNGGRLPDAAVGEAGTSMDSGMPRDAGMSIDAAGPTDATRFIEDGVPRVDARVRDDAANVMDAGTGVTSSGGCGCRAGTPRSSALALGLTLTLTLAARRRAVARRA